MTPKQRNIIAQHWASMIVREGRDLASLAQIAARAMADRDVQADATLQSQIRADIDRHRADFERDQQNPEPSIVAPKSRPNVHRNVDIGRRTYSTVAPAPQPHVQPEPREPVREAFDQLARALKEWLARGDAGEAGAVCEKMRALQGESRGIIPVTALQQYEQQIEGLRTRLEGIQDEIKTLAQQAIAASRKGDERTVAKMLLRLSAIHVTHPRLLDEAQWDQFRDNIIHANEQYNDGLTARKLVERERSVAEEIKKVAAAVHEFHRVVCAVPDTSEEFRGAEAAYLRTLQEARTQDTEWLAGFVLELADLLAEWTEPPLTAAKQIDHFLESIRLGLKRIHVEMGEIDARRGEPHGS